MALGLEVEFAVLNHEGTRHIVEPACLAFIPKVFRLSRPVELVTRLRSSVDAAGPPDTRQPCVCSMCAVTRMEWVAQLVGRGTHTRSDGYLWADGFAATVIASNGHMRPTQSQNSLLALLRYT